MSAPTTHDANDFLSSAAATSLLAELRVSTNGRIGDRLSQAIRAVTRASSTLPPDEVDSAIAAIALLLAATDPTVLDGAADEEALRGWLHHVDTELTPGRRLKAEAALARMEIGDNNDWYAAHESSGTLPDALKVIHRLRDGLHDASGG
jgi:hypothetical protein